MTSRSDLGGGAAGTGTIRVVVSRIECARLLTAGSSSARRRLFGIVAGVAIGVALFLLLWGASDALAARAARSTWTDVAVSGAPLDARHPQLPPGTIGAAHTDDHVDGRVIEVVEVAGGADAPVGIPGIERIPMPGEAFVSPALVDRIAARPADELGARFGSVAGTIDESALAGPDALVAVVGVPLDELASSSYVRAVTELRGSPYPSSNYRFVAIVGAIATLVPVLVLIAIVADLGAAQRAERDSALRMLGVRRRRVAALSAAESTAASFAGSVLGVGAAAAATPIAARIRIEDVAFFTRDLLVAPWKAGLVVVAVVAAGAGVSWWRTLRAGVGPLGASRTIDESRPRALALVPLGIGVVMLAAALAFALGGSHVPLTYGVVFGGFVLTMLGVLAAGPYLVRRLARAGSRIATGPAALIALARIEAHPRAVFRGVAGMLAAVYAVTVFAVAITTASDEAGASISSVHRPESTLVASMATDAMDGTAGSDAAVAMRAADEAANTRGGRAAAVGWRAPEGDGTVFSVADAARVGLVTDGGDDTDATGDDADATGDDASTDHAVQSDAGFIHFDGDPFAGAAAPAPAGALDPASLDPVIIVVATDGASDSIERVRTTLATSGLVLVEPAQTLQERSDASLRMVEQEYATLAYLAMIISAAIAAGSLAVSTLAAVVERRRIFGLLRLCGMPRRVLGRVIALEAWLPFCAMVLGCILLGAFSAWALVAGITEGRRSVDWPGPVYWLVVAACVGLVAAGVGTALRVGMRETDGAAATRFE